MADELEVVLKNFALPMILSNLSIELEHLLDPTLVQELIEDVVVR